MSTNLPVSIDALVGGLTKTIQRSAMDNPDGSAYLKLSKGGFWIYGTDDMEVEDESLWAVNPHSFMVGFIAWKDGVAAPLGEEMVSVTAEPLIVANLQDVGASWSAQVGMQMVCVSGEDKGEKVIYKSNSHGGRKRFQEFLQQVLVQLSSGVAGDKVVPVIELDVDSYKHKTYGQIFQPIFKIDSWRTMEDTLDDEPVADSGGLHPGPAEEPAPAEPKAEEPTKRVRRKRRSRKAA